MNSLSLALIDEHHLYVSGEVVVHPSAVIAPGVMLQADPSCRLVIGAGVCVGQGTILHAHQGILTIESGVVLGNGVLIVGQGTIGMNACIGPFSTLISCSVAANQLIPPRSLVGDASRKVELEATSTPVIDSEVPPSQASAPAQARTVSPPSPPPSAPKPSPDSASSASTTETVSASPSEKTLTQVYGQAYVERIMITMFPHRRSLNDNPSNDVQDPASPSESPPANPPP